MANKVSLKGAISIGIGGMVGSGTFAAYEGFELIANAAPDIINPKVNIPRAYWIAVIFVVLLYVVIAIVTVGSLPFNEIATAEDYMLAEAAKPMLGDLGFTVITIAALISTFSAINASLYGGSRVSYEIAEDDELPHHLTSTLWNQPIGLMITAIATLILTNTLDLESISTAGSVGFLFIFGLVNVVGYRTRKATGATAMVPLLGALLCFLALLLLMIQQYESNPTGVIVAISILMSCFIFEYLYKHSGTKLESQS